MQCTSFHIYSIINIMTHISILSHWLVNVEYRKLNFSSTRLVNNIHKNINNLHNNNVDSREEKGKH